MNSSGNNIDEESHISTAHALFGVFSFLVVLAATVPHLQLEKRSEIIVEAEVFKPYPIPPTMKAFIVGATGGVGQALVKELAKKSSVEQVTIIGRRKLDLPQGEVDGANYNKFDQKIVDFDQLEANHAADFAGYDVGFCALGTTRGKAGKAGFYKVDHDYVVGSAKLAKAGGVKHFQLVSAASANKNSFVYYSQVKGEAEEEIRQLNFERFTIWQPALLLVERNESRLGESIFQHLLGPLDRARFWSIEVPMLARVMVNHCFETPKAATEVFANRQIYHMGTASK